MHHVGLAALPACIACLKAARRLESLAGRTSTPIVRSLTSQNLSPEKTAALAQKLGGEGTGQLVRAPPCLDCESGKARLWMVRHPTPACAQSKPV